MNSEIHKEELEKENLQMELMKKEQDEKDRLVPEIDRFRKMIEDMHNNIRINEVNIEKEN